MDARAEAAPEGPPEDVTQGLRAWYGAGLAVGTVGWGAQQFAPLLLLYQADLHLATSTIQGTFAMYVVGLIPGLLLGGPTSDRFGRRRVMGPTLVASAAATVLLILGGSGVGWLLAGRLLAGVASGAAFSSGAAWIKELSEGHRGGVNPGPRRATVAMTLGFGLGPLVAGVLAQWAPAPTVVPYLPHLVLVAVALPLALSTRETKRPSPEVTLRRRLRIPEARGRRFLTVVVPLAPWVFGSASIALAYLPGLVERSLAGNALLFSAIVTLLTAAAGILVQPLARRAYQPHTSRLLATALTIVVAGVLVAAGAAATATPALVIVAALVLGAGYGCCQVGGLVEVQRLAPPDRLAGLTAVYQAVSYLGFAAPFPLAAAAGFVPPAELLCVVAGLAVLTLAWTTWQARRT
jgi:predicted MFS family arabinose efflux permease